jgi:hypothetical protein
VEIFATRVVVISNLHITLGGLHLSFRLLAGFPSPPIIIILSSLNSEWLADWLMLGLVPVAVSQHFQVIAAPFLFYEMQCYGIAKAPSKGKCFGKDVRH